MKCVAQIVLAYLFSGWVALTANADYTSLRVYGDSLSCTTNNPSAGPSYYGQRYSNGRVWVEVLAQLQGLTFSNSLNNSYYGNYSTNILNTVKAAAAPQDSNTTLVVVWANNADLFDLAQYTTTTLTTWTNTIKQSQTNHYSIITNLYAKGIRTLVMPNVVDLSTIPQCNHSSGGYTNTIHQKCLAYNAAFTNTLNRAKADCPGLVIYSPDFYTLLTNLFAYPSDYGVTNALFNYGGIIASVDAINGLGGSPLVTSNPGTNYIFWDPFNPSAKVHNWMASLAQQLISPVNIGQIVPFNGSNRLDIVNVPVGLTNGCLVLGRTNLTAGNWTTNLVFTSTNISQSVFVPGSGPQWFYRLSFPVTWTWP